MREILRTATVLVGAVLLPWGCVNEGHVAVTYDAAGYLGEFMGQHESALKGFREVVQMRPDLPARHYNEGVALANLGRWADALAAFRKATALEPTLARAHLGAGVALVKLGRVDEAAGEFRLAGRSDVGGVVALRDVPYCTHTPCAQVSAPSHGSPSSQSRGRFSSHGRSSGSSTDQVPATSIGREAAAPVHHANGWQSTAAQHARRTAPGVAAVVLRGFRGMTTSLDRFD